MSAATRLPTISDRAIARAIRQHCARMEAAAAALLEGPSAAGLAPALRWHRITDAQRAAEELSAALEPVQRLASTCWHLSPGSGGRPDEVERMGGADAVAARLEAQSAAAAAAVPGSVRGR